MLGGILLCAGAGSTIAQTYFYVQNTGGCTAYYEAEIDTTGTNSWQHLASGTVSPHTGPTYVTMTWYGARIFWNDSQPVDSNHYKKTEQKLTYGNWYASWDCTNQAAPPCYWWHVVWTNTCDKGVIANWMITDGQTDRYPAGEIGSYVFAGAHADFWVTNCEAWSGTPNLLYGCKNGCCDASYVYEHAPDGNQNNGSGGRSTGPGSGGGTPGSDDGAGGSSTNGVDGGDIDGLGRALASIDGEVRKLNKEDTQKAGTNLLGQIAGQGTNLAALVAQGSSLTGALSFAWSGTNGIPTNATFASVLTNKLDKLAEAMAQLANPTNWTQWTNPATIMPGWTEATGIAYQVEAAIAANPWGSRGVFSNAGPWGGAMGGIEGGAGSNYFGNLIGSGVSGIADPSTTDWLSIDLPQITVGTMTFRQWSWDWTPKLPSDSTAANILRAGIYFIRLTWVVFITYFLWWDIKQDIQRALMTLASVPTPQVSGDLKAMAVQVITRIVMSSVAISTLYTFTAHLVSWLTGAIANWGESGAWSDITSVLSTGTINGVTSPWIPRVAYWALQAFPINLALSALATWVVYCTTRDTALRLAVVVLKRTGSVLILALCLWPAANHVSASTPLTDAGSSGSIIVSCAWTNRLAVDCGDGQGLRDLQSDNAGRSSWEIPVTSQSVVVGSQSNFIGDLGLISGSSILVDQAGGMVVARPDTIARENTLLMWGSAGIATGAFFGFLSLLGFVWKRAIKPGKWASSSGGSD